MAEYLSPGVYVEEVESGAKSIEGVSTSTAAFLGEPERGPVTPQFVTSFAEFKRNFGGYTQYQKGEPLFGTNLAYAVDGFFRNGGSRCYVGRVTTATEIGRTAFGGYEPPFPLVADTDGIEFDELVVGRSDSVTVDLKHAGFEHDPPFDVTGVSIVAGTGPDASAAPYDFRLAGGATVDFPLAPGERQTIEVTYEPGTQSHTTALLRVEHTGADSPLEVPIEGVASTDAEAVTIRPDPDPLDFGTVPTGEPIVETVTVTNEGLTGRAGAEITNVGIADDGNGDYDVENANDFQNNVPLAPGESVDVQVSFERTSAARPEATLEVDVDIGGGARTPTIRTALRANSVEAGQPAGALGTSAIAVDFGGVATGHTVHRTVTLFNSSSADPIQTPHIREFTYSGPDDAMEATLLNGATEEPIDPGSPLTLRLSLTALTEDTIEEAVTVHFTADGTDRTRDVDVHAEATDEPGVLATEPPVGSTLDFGSVPTGEEEVRTVDLANGGVPGAGDVDVVRVERAGEDPEHFSVPNEFEPDPPNEPARTLEQDKSVALPVTYEPPAETESSAELAVTWDDGSGETTTRFVLVGEGVGPVMDVQAVGPGEWGGRVAVHVRNGTRGNDTFSVTIDYWTEMEAGGASDAERIAAQDDPAVSETFDDLSTDQSASNYYETVINSGSYLVEVDRLGPGRPANGSELLDVPPEDDDVPDDLQLSHFQGDGDAPRGERTGLAGFSEIDDISIVTIPDQYQVTGLTDALVTHCELQADRFAVLQAPQGVDPTSLPQGEAISEYAAIYYPHLEIVDPQTSMKTLVPPGGHIAGIYARTDAEQGVHKAPANAPVRGAVGLEVPVTKADQDMLNPKGVNAIRSFPGRGIRVWGARTTSADPEWKYVNVRRLFLYIEESIQEGTQWAVFESNNEQLWARVRQSVRNFLTTVWREGGLMGSSPDEAFYVKADRTTMTQDDIDKGRLIVEIGIAPVKPAEFVVFRIAQWTEGVEGGS
jgi:phage tail sheath protein FI